MPLNAPELAERIEAVTWPIDRIVVPWHGPSTAQGKLALTYHLASSQPADLSTNFNGWTALAPPQQEAVRAALGQFEEVINVAFEETAFDPDPDFHFGRVSMRHGGQGGFEYFYWTNGEGEVTEHTWDGYSVFNSDLALTDDMNLILHEIGHALGLKHPGNYDVGGNPPPGPYLSAGEDNNRYTVMSYNPHDVTGELSARLMLYDIAALQAMWGANYETRKGDTVYFGPGADPDLALAKGEELAVCIWDGGGRDVISAANQSSSAKIDLREGSFSSIGASRNTIAIAYGAEIEDAKGGSGADKLTGNGAANFLVGNDGKDKLKAFSGSDTLDGGEGADRMSGGEGADIFSFDRLADSGSGRNRDEITDFSSAQGDLLDFSGFRSIDFVGSARFSGERGELRFSIKKGDAVVQLDGDGDSKAEFNIVLNGVDALTLDDLVL